MLTSHQCKAARALSDMDLRKLSAESGVAVATINRFELQQSRPNRSTLAALRRAFEAAGVEFGDDGWMRRKP